MPKKIKLDNRTYSATRGNFTKAAARAKAKELRAQSKRLGWGNSYRVIKSSDGEGYVVYQA